MGHEDNRPVASLASHIWKTRNCVQKGPRMAVNNLMADVIPQ